MNAELKKDGTLELKIRREFSFPKELVFDAWIKIEHLYKWMGPTDEISVENIEADVREGGSYRMTFRQPDGVGDTVYGVYRTIKRPEKLVFTWIWEPPTPGADVETLVTVDFIETSSGTKVTLHHQKFVSQEICDRHQWGWNGTLDKLERRAGQLKG